MDVGCVAVPEERGTVPRRWRGGSRRTTRAGDQVGRQGELPECAYCHGVGGAACVATGSSSKGRHGQWRAPRATLVDPRGRPRPRRAWFLSGGVPLLNWLPRAKVRRRARWPRRYCWGPCSSPSLWSSSRRRRWGEAWWLSGSSSSSRSLGMHPCVCVCVCACACVGVE